MSTLNERRVILDAGKILLCPECGHNMHQRRVSIFARTEDAERTRVVDVNLYTGELSTQELPSHKVDNPSARRHGMTIYFDCEICGAEKPTTIPTVVTHILHLAQHKGFTYLVWDDVDVPRLGNPTDVG